jgi:hypothetical protein
MFAENQNKGRRRFVTKNIAIALILGVILVVGALFVIEDVFALRGCFGPCGRNSITANVVLCSSRNVSCELTLINSGPATVQAIGCSFDTIYGNASTIIRTGGPATLSDRPGGQGATINITSSSSATAFCYLGAYSPLGKNGTQVSGTVFFANDGPNAASFVGIWQ